MVYNLKAENTKKGNKGKIVFISILLVLIAALLIGKSIYMELIQLDEIGQGLTEIFITNLIYKIASAAAAFAIILVAVNITNFFIRKNIKLYMKQNNIVFKKIPDFLISVGIAFLGAIMSSSMFYQKALSFYNSTAFGEADPIFSKDIGYYVFERPFLMSLYEFASSLWLFVILYSAAYYILVLVTNNTNLTIQDFNIKSWIRHNLVNIAVFFLIKALSYRFEAEEILYSNVLGVKGAGYIDVNIWLKYYAAAPFLIVLIVAVSLFFLWKNKIKRAAISIAVFPIIWIVVSAASGIIQSLVVHPNEKSYEMEYLAYNIENTQRAFNISNINVQPMDNISELTPESLQRNRQTMDNIRVVDYEATLTTNRQIQSIKPYYSFSDGDIINYMVNGKETPVFITAREMDKENIPDKTYINKTYGYTHGYGVVINPINRVRAGGAADFIVSELTMKSVDPGLKIEQPRIYYGEMTNDHVIVNANNIDEIDFDGDRSWRYDGQGGINLNLLNRLLFALEFADTQMILSEYAPNATILINRNVVDRAQKAVPFLSVDRDPYIIPTSDGRLKWVLDAYTTSRDYPYSQEFAGVNYIRNSVKIVIDAYDGKVEYYIIDKNDPMIETYGKMYPGVFKDEPLPEDIANHSRYPELLFKLQTDVLKRYHVDSKDASAFYTKQDMWDLAKYPVDRNASNVVDIDAYYNMIKLPAGIGENEELILMRPFTPANKNNMISWLAVRNSKESYGELILFSFSNNTSVLGPYQVEAKINQIDSVSRDMTLWGQSGSDVFKGSLLAIPIENSVLYVEPIYIRAAATSSVPEIELIITGYQRGDDFEYGIGKSLDEALDNLFKGIKAPPEDDPVEPEEPVTPAQPDSNTEEDVRIMNDILSKYNELKRQLEDLGNLINELAQP